MNIVLFLSYRQADMKFRCGLRSLQNFNAILLRSSRLLRNFPRPGVILVIHKIWLRFQHVYHDRLSYHSQFIKNILLTLVHVIILLYAAIFYLLGEPILQHLLCCRVFAVKDHSFIPCASHLQQPRLVNNQDRLHASEG